MGDVIELDQHRVDPETMWFVGVVKCVYCGHEHIAVAPMPSWAATPMTGECPKCERMGVIPVNDEYEPGSTGERPWLVDGRPEPEPPEEAIETARQFLRPPTNE